MSADASVAGGTVLLAAGGVVRQVAFLFAITLFARKMVPDDFGVASIWYSAVLVLIGVADWGVRFSGWTDIARRGMSREVITRNLLYKTILSVIVGVLLITGMLVTEQGMPPTLLVLSVFGLLVFNQLSVEWIFRGIRDFRSVLAMNVLAGAVFVGFAAYASEGASVARFLWSICIANAVSVLLGFVLLRWRGYRCGAYRPFQFVSFFRRNLGPASASVLNRSYSNYPVVLTGFIAAPYVAAQLRPSHMVFMFASTLAYYVVGAIFSLVAANSARTLSLSRLVRVLVVLAVAGLAVAVVGANFLAEPFIRHFFGLGYEDAIPMLKTTMWVLPFGFFAMFVRELAPAVNLERFSIVITCAALLAGSFGTWVVIASGRVSFLPLAIGAGEGIVAVLGAVAILRRVRARAAGDGAVP